MPNLAVYVAYVLIGRTLLTLLEELKAVEVEMSNL